jgi:hypothetical protein
MIDHETQLERIVAADHADVPPPDLAVLVAAGRRRLRRRRTATGIASVAAAAVLAVPAYVVATLAGGERDASDTTVASSAPAVRQGCVLCRPPAASSRTETGVLLGEPLVIGTQPGGVEEVLYAVRTDGTDLLTGEQGPVDVLKLGWRQEAELHPAASTVQPGYDGISPDGDPVRFWSSYSVQRQADEFLVVGYVEGAPAEVSWSTPAGDSGPVDATSTAVIDDYTVFYLTRPLPDGSEPPSYRQVPAPGGDTAIEINPRGGFPPPLTIHTSDGWSCSLQRCGSVG